MLQRWRGATAGTTVRGHAWLSRLPFRNVLGVIFLEDDSPGVGGEHARLMPPHDGTIGVTGESKNVCSSVAVVAPDP